MPLTDSPTDRLDLSAALVIALGLLVLAAAASIALHAGLRSHTTGKADAAVFRAIGMTAPALLPSGRPQRAPETVDPRIHLRYTPFLPLPDPDPANRVFHDGKSCP